MGNREFLSAMIEILEVELETVKALGRLAGADAERKCAVEERELVLRKEIALLNGATDGEVISGGFPPKNKSLIL